MLHKRLLSLAAIFAFLVSNGCIGSDFPILGQVFPNGVPSLLFTQQYQQRKWIVFKPNGAKINDQYPVIFVEDSESCAKIIDAFNTLMKPYGKEIDTLIYGSAKPLSSSDSYNYDDFKKYESLVRGCKRSQNN